MVHILLVEDNEGHVELVRRAFESRNGQFRLTTASSCREARRLMQESPPDLMVTDLLLPDGEGTGLLSGEGQEAAFPVVVMTSHGDERAAVEAMKAGAMDYVVKSPATFADMPHIAERTLREWGLIAERRQIEEQLRRAQNMESIGTLASGVAHNFNNLLGIIVGNAELAKFKLPPVHEAREFLEKIATATERAANLSRQLLSMSRLGSGERAHVNVSFLVDNISQAMRMMMDSNIEITWRVASPEAQVHINHPEIEQALMNICLNARDAMPKGGTILIGVTVVDLPPSFCAGHPAMRPGPHVCISISDTGTGMDEETRSRVFDPFFTTKEPGKGTGLGLWTAYRATVNHGGCIDVESKIGKGTTVRIYLPVAHAREEEKPTAQEPEDLVRGDGTVLVVDDEEEMLHIARRCVERLGYVALTAGNGIEAVETYRRRHAEISLVLLDYMMPKMAGEEAYVEMKKINPDVRVLIASGYQADEKIQRILRAGANGFVHKPYRLSGLSQALSDALGKST